jgi:hypothetical protein
VSESFDQHTPSLVAGLQRFWLPILVVVLFAGMLGGAYAVATFTPTVGMTVGVDVATSPSSGSVNSNDAARATSEVAAALASPAVMERTEELAGVNVDGIDAFSEEDSSTVEVVISAASVADAEAAADSLVLAYTEVSTESARKVLETRLAAIDESLEPLEEERSTVGQQLGQVPAGSGEFAQLDSRYESLTAQVQALSTQRSEAILAASGTDIVVDVASAPAASSSVLSAIMRFVPVAMVGALVVCMLVVVYLARRRPWLTEAEYAGDILGAPLLAVGPRSPGAAQSGEVAAVVGLSVQRALPSKSAMVVFLPIGAKESATRSVVERSAMLAEQVSNVMARAGRKVTVAHVGSHGEVRFGSPDGSTADLAELWVDGSANAEELTSALRARGIDADVVVVAPQSDLGPEALLDLVDASDLIVVTVLSRSPLDPMYTARRELTSLGRTPLGVVVDPPR